MKIVVDLSVCDAHGECVVEAPSLFELGDEDQQVTVLQEEVSGELADAAQRAEDSCPEAAITLED